VRVDCTDPHSRVVVHRPKPHLVVVILAAAADLALAAVEAPASALLVELVPKIARNAP
jgi:hypothetical protein